MKITSAQSSLLLISIVLFNATTIFISCKKDTKQTYPWEYEEGEENSAGTLTVFDESENAYNHAIPGLSDADETKFVVGNSFNKMNWVIAPSSATATDGLGPLFNAKSCSGCHFLDGRGKPPGDGEDLISMVFKLASPGSNVHGGPLPVTNFGGQLGNNAIPGATAEGGVVILYTTVSGTYPDGTPYSLRKPGYTFENGALAGALFSPRVAPKMAGTGFFDAIPSTTILSYADENDLNGDGISGKPNYVWDFTENKTVLGRIGWKANTPSIRQQVAGAFVNDIGITSSIFPNEDLSGDQATNFAGIPNGGNPELSDEIREKVYFYTSTLAVPSRRNVKDEEVLQGKNLFVKIGCGSCHIPKMQTGIHPDIAYLNNITIRPYTDLLLHDMGEGLEDGMVDYLATGREWRTAPLWGMGIQNTVNNHTTLLHDGRARNAEEAILWHGGEANTSKNHFMELTKESRALLIKFLDSL